VAAAVAEPKRVLYQELVALVLLLYVFIILMKRAILLLRYM
jgi:hypothetical protein